MDLKRVVLDEDSMDRICSQVFKNFNDETPDSILHEQLVAIKTTLLARGLSNLDIVDMQTRQYSIELDKGLEGLFGGADHEN